MLDYLKKRQDKIIRDGLAGEAIDFAKRVPDADVRQLQRVVIEHGTVWDVASFSFEISVRRGADLDQLAQAILDKSADEAGKAGSDAPLAAYYFTRYADDMRMEDMQNVVLNGTNGEIAMKFAQDIPGADIAALQDVVLKYGKPSNIVDMVAEIHDPRIDTKACEKALMEKDCFTGDSLYMFARHVKDADLPAIHARLVQLAEDHQDNDTRTILAEFNQDKGIQERMRSAYSGVTANAVEADKTTKKPKHT